MKILMLLAFSKPACCNLWTFTKNLNSSNIKKLMTIFFTDAAGNSIKNLLIIYEIYKIIILNPKYYYFNTCPGFKKQLDCA